MIRHLFALNGTNLLSYGALVQKSDPSALGLIRLISRCLLGRALGGGFGQTCVPKLIQVVGRTHFSRGHKAEVCFIAGCQLVASLSSFRPPIFLVTLPVSLSL